MSSENGSERKEALERLLSHDGWAVLREEVGRVHSSDKVILDLLSLLERTTDMTVVGALVAARLNAYKAVQGIFELPAALISVYENQEAQNAARARPANAD